MGSVFVRGSRSCMMQQSGFNPAGSHPVEEIFPLELAGVLTPFPGTLSDESVNRGPVCAHMQSMDSKDPDIHVLDW